MMWMRANHYTVKRVANLKQSARRAIAFLRSTIDDEIDAAMAFERLNAKKEREVRDRFDYWIDGGRMDKYFHGWPNNPTYKNCFVFKWKENRANHRLYGFLCHPTPIDNGGFQVCILVSHATKTTWETDLRELDGARALSVDMLVISAIKKEFPDSIKDVKTRWLN